MKIVLHHVPQSRSMRSLWLLHELGIPFETVVHPFNKALRAPAFLALSPAGRVPALEVGELCLFETGAITQYLCEQFSPTGLGRRNDHPERADWLIWVHFSETISQHAAALTQQHVALREDHMRSPIVMKLEVARIMKCYDALEARLRGDEAAYILPSGFSAADISLGQAIYMARHFARTDSHPKVSAWYARLEQRAAFQASLPATDERLFAQTYFAPWPVE